MFLSVNEKKKKKKKEKKEKEIILHYIQYCDCQQSPFSQQRNQQGTKPSWNWVSQVDTVYGKEVPKTSKI
jgi:hypothetical protein